MHPLFIRNLQKHRFAFRIADPFCSAQIQVEGLGFDGHCQLDYFRHRFQVRLKKVYVFLRRQTALYSFNNMALFKLLS